MPSSAPLDDRVLELVTLFNQQKSDLPDGLLQKDCVLRLNGRAYHEHLGRPIADPLVRLVGCGPAGYRFVLAALRYAMDRPRLDLHLSPVVERSASGASVLHARGLLTGTLRGRSERFHAECALVVDADAAGQVRQIAVTMGDADVELLLAARRA